MIDSVIPSEAKYIVSVGHAQILALGEILHFVDIYFTGTFSGTLAFFPKSYIYYKKISSVSSE